MSMVVKRERSNIPQLEPGVYYAIAKEIIDLGIQENMLYNTKQRKVMIIWEIIGETVKVGENELPRTVSKEYTMSLNSKGILVKDLEAWRGRPFTEKELNGFNLVNILNVPCQLQVNKKENKDYTYIAGIMAIPKDIEIEKLEDTYVFDTYDSKTWANYEKIPNWIKEKIKKALNLVETQLDLYIKDCEEKKKEQEGKEEDTQDKNINDKSLPF